MPPSSRTSGSVQSTRIFPSRPSSSPSTSRVAPHGSAMTTTFARSTASCAVPALAPAPAFATDARAASSEGSSTPKWIV